MAARPRGCFTRGVYRHRQQCRCRRHRDCQHNDRSQFTAPPPWTLRPPTTGGSMRSATAARMRAMSGALRPKNMRSSTTSKPTTTTISRIYDAWVDGVTTQASGSQVGYDESPFAEKTIVHGGAQSMPLMYDNTASPYYSEAERTFDTPQNLDRQWSPESVSVLPRRQPVVCPDCLRQHPDEWHRRRHLGHGRSVPLRV